VESSYEFGIEPSGSMKCWETIECQHLVASRVVFSSIGLVITQSSGLSYGLHQLCENGYQRWTFPFLLVPELSPSLRYSNFRLSNSSLLADYQRVTLRLAMYRQSVRPGAKPFEAHDRFFLSIEPLRSLSLSSIYPNERKGRFVQLLLSPAIAVILRSESRGTNGHILLSQMLDPVNLEGQVTVFISPRNRVAQF
jgi:hypothetical protein